MQRSIHQRLDALSCTDIKPLDRSFSLTGKAWTLRYGPVGLEGARWATAIDAGVPLRQARADYGYHALQTPRG